MKPVTRTALTWAGHACVLLGFVGAFLPLLPTTPFLLLAAACYVRGSERHHRWLMNNRIFGPILRNYQEKRAISRRTKVMALAVLWASLVFSVWRVRPLALDGLLIALSLVFSGVILRVRTLKKSESPDA